MTKNLKNTQEINKIVTTFPLEKQQEVLNFVKFLQSQLSQKQLSKNEEKNISIPEFNNYLDEKTEINDSQQSALELAGDLVGCLNAPEDLSTNKKYFEGFGK